MASRALRTLYWELADRFDACVGETEDGSRERVAGAAKLVQSNVIAQTHCYIAALVWIVHCASADQADPTRRSTSAARRDHFWPESWVMSLSAWLAA
jgi:hypothetical protein